MSNEELLSQSMNAHLVEVELELWDALLNADAVSYSWQASQTPSEADFQVEEMPEARIGYLWNPADVGSESYFDDTNRVSIFDGWQDSEITSRAETLFGHMEQLWSTTALQQTLQQRLAVQMPHSLLSAIARKAQLLATTSANLADQLVQCVRDNLPSLAEEDLYVLARPYAYALRDGGSQAVELTQGNVPKHEWHNLSEIHQARLSLAIARCALDELQNQSSQ